MHIPCDTIDTHGLLDFETFLLDRSSKYRQTDPRKSAKKCPILGKASMFKFLRDFWFLKFWGIFERQGLVSFVVQRDFDDTGIDGLTRRSITFFGDPSSQKHVEAGAGIRTRPIKCEHTVKHYCFIDTDFTGANLASLQGKPPGTRESGDHNSLCRNSAPPGFGFGWGKCHKTRHEAIIFVVADGAEMLPPVTLVLARRYRRRFKSSVESLTLSK